MFTSPARALKPAPKTLFGAVALAAALTAGAASAGPVGQSWRVFPDPSAVSRDYLGRAQVRALVWYPAGAGVVEQTIAIGPPTEPTFTGGAAAPEAAWARGGKRPLIVMSHGAGGTALQYGWLGADLARRGYIVIAVDHPGASGGERATDAGNALWWRRADDVTAAIDAALADPVLGPRIDQRRIGMVGYSLGGATGLLLAGARPSLPAIQAACTVIKNAACGMLGQVSGELVADRADRRIRAFALIAPGLIPLIDLAPVGKAPSLTIAGDADEVVPAPVNGAVSAKAMGGRLEMLPGVMHNDFLQTCTDLGRTRYADLCKQTTAQRESTHAKAADLIGGFFESALR